MLRRYTRTENLSWIFHSFFLFYIVYLGFSNICFAKGILLKNANIVNIDGIRYEASLASIAIEPSVVLEIEFGAKESNVGGYEQDTDHETRGVPYAFFPTEKDELYVLDWANKCIKKFSLLTGSGSIVLNLKNKVKDIVKDFCKNDEGDFYLLGGLQGKVYKVSKNNDILLEIDGLLDANSIKLDKKNNIVVDYSVQQKVLVFSQEGELIKSVIKPNDMISHTSLDTDNENNIYCVHGDNNLLYLSKISLDNPANWYNIATFTNHVQKEYKTRFVSGKVIGIDQNDNIYIEIVIVNDDGVRFSNRIYKLNKKGQILKYKEIRVKPYLSPDLPRHMVVYKDSVIFGFYVKNDKWVIIKWEL